MLKVHSPHGVNTMAREAQGQHEEQHSQMVAPWNLRPGILGLRNLCLRFQKYLLSHFSPLQLQVCLDYFACENPWLSQARAALK